MYYSLIYNPYGVHFQLAILDPYHFSLPQIMALCACGGTGVERLRNSRAWSRLGRHSQTCYPLQSVSTSHHVVGLPQWLLVFSGMGLELRCCHWCTWLGLRCDWVCRIVGTNYLYVQCACMRTCVRVCVYGRTYCTYVCVHVCVK